MNLWTRLLVMLVALTVACSGDGNKDSTKTTSPATTVATAVATSAATAVATSAPGEPIIGSQITMADITADIPTTQDGRTWYPAAGLGSEILLNAQRRVPPVSGEPVPQGDARYDQQFWLWNPMTDERRLAWINESERYEWVQGIDGDWALGYLYKNMPGNQWTSRLHNMATGEQRDVSNLDPAAVGIDSNSNPVIGGGRVAYVHKVPGGDGSLVERVELYDISRNTTTTLSEAAAGPFGSAGPQVSVSGQRVAWTDVSPAGSIAGLHVLDTATGASTLVQSDSERAWTEIAANGEFILGEPSSPSSPTFRFFARSTLGGPVTTYLQAAVSMGGARGNYVSWIGRGTPTDLRGYYDIPRNTLHILAPGIPVRGQNSGIVNGWFYWVEPGPEGAQDFAGGALHVVRL